MSGPYDKIDSWLNAVNVELRGLGEDAAGQVIDLIVYAVQRDPQDWMSPREMAARLIAARAMNITPEEALK